MRFLLCVASICFAFIAGRSAQAETLVLGFISTDQRQEIERAAPLADYLKTHLADHGVTDVQISILQSSHAMAAALRMQQIDLFFDSPIVSAHVASESGAQPFLRRWKYGVNSYHSVIIVSSDSQAIALDDLAGSTIGFEQADSSSGYMVPIAMLRQAGLSPHQLPDNESPLPTQLGYRFTGSDRNSIYWLARGHIDAAATDPRGWAWLEDAQPGAFRVLARSAEFPRSVVTHRLGMNATFVEAIADVLRSMDEDQHGVEAMAAFSNTTQFDDFPDGPAITFAPIYQLLHELEMMDMVH